MSPHARLNYAENALLGHKFARSTSQRAVISVIEPAPDSRSTDGQPPGFIRHLSFDELYLEVAQAASQLKKLGIKEGDRVAGLTPNNAGMHVCCRICARANCNLFPNRGHHYAASNSLARCDMEFFTSRVWCRSDSRPFYSGSHEIGKRL